MTNTLGLDDDLDSVDALESIEKAFDIKLAKEEAERIVTVGQMYDLLVSKIPKDAADRKCATAMAFYRLRAAMRQFGIERASPSTDIEFLEASGAKSAFASIEKNSGLRLPPVAMATTGFVGCLLFVISAIAAVVLSAFLGKSLLSLQIGACAVAIMVGYFLVRVDPGKLPKGCATLGDLSRKTATVSYGKLIKSGAAHRNEDIWNTLLDLLSCYALPRSEITRDTVFLQSQLGNIPESAA